MHGSTGKKSTLINVSNKVQGVVVPVQRWKRETREKRGIGTCTRRKEKNNDGSMKFRVFNALPLFLRQKTSPLIKLFQNHRIISGTELNDHEMRIFHLPFCQGNEIFDYFIFRFVLQMILTTILLTVLF
jgi:hypothetical protein